MEEITEYTQNGDCRFLAYIPSWWKNQPWLVGVGGARPPPLSLLPSRKKLQCTLLLRGQIHLLYFHSPYTVSVEEIDTIDEYILYVCEYSPCWHTQVPPPPPPQAQGEIASGGLSGPQGRGNTPWGSGKPPPPSTPPIDSCVKGRGKYKPPKIQNKLCKYTDGYSFGTFLCILFPVYMFYSVSVNTRHVLG